MIKLTPLFSGSSGNCTLVQTPHTNVLLDAGFGYRAVLSRLAVAGLKLADISAIFITHEHSDHISALPQLNKYGSAQIFVPAPAVNYVAQTCLCSNLQGIDGALDISDLHVDVYRCSHDARACFGYRFQTEDDCVASVTDTGVVTSELVEFLSPCRAIILESNYDVEMLQNGPYPFPLKRRIASDLGHLSNVQTAQILTKLARSRVKSVCLGHISQHNNTPELARHSAETALATAGCAVGKDVTVYVADQYKNEVTL